MPATSFFLRKHWAFLLSGSVLTALSVEFLDRPVSFWLHRTTHGKPFYDGLTHIVDPLLPAAVIGLLLLGISAAFLGWRPRERGTTALAACLAVVISVAIKEELKFVFGRTWPETWIDHNPSWIGNGVYGFNFFHGGDGWASFPSGHMTQISAAAGVLWIRWTRLRLLWVVLVAAVAVGLLASDYHFLGDVIAGIYLGLSTAYGVVALLGNGHRCKGVLESNAERDVSHD